MLNRLTIAAAPLALSACVIVVDSGPHEADLASDYVAQADRLPARSDLAAFTGVHAAAGTDVTVRGGEAFRIELDERAQERTVFEIEGGTLKVTCRKRGRAMGSCMRGDRGDAVVTMPEADAFRVSSGAVLRVEKGVGLMDELDIRASSGGDMRLADDLGTVASLTARASSGGSLDATGVTAARAEADASSGGSLRVHVTAQLEADASSGGSVSYEGNPEVERSTSSGGSVRGR